MTERLRFVLAVHAGEESMAAVCRRFGISRKTGYKLLGRFAADGAAGLTDRSRAPHHHPQAVPAVVREALLALRGQHPTWGPKKLAVRLPEVYPDLVAPAPSTIGELLAAAGLVVPRRRRRHTPPRTAPLAHATRPNAVWCADCTGDFELGDGTRCYPLTITDAHRRLLLRCQALPTTATERVQPLFEATFREYGLPEVIRTDNGVPFATTGAGGLSRLSVDWVKRGIRPERIDPGCPSQNGRHERMHRTLKAETCREPAPTPRVQQQVFDQFRHLYNAVRPHEALGQRTPASVDTPAARPFAEHVPEPTYPAADGVRWVRPNGALRWQGGEVDLTQALAGEAVGLTQVGDGVWELCFGSLVLGRWQEGTSMLIPAAGSPRGTRRRASWACSWRSRARSLVSWLAGLRPRRPGLPGRGRWRPAAAASSPDARRPSLPGARGRRTGRGQCTGPLPGGCAACRRR